MIFRSTFIVLFSFTFIAISRASIKCDFRYTEYEQTATNEIIVDETSKDVVPEVVVVQPEIKGPFDCDDGFEKILAVGSRFNDDFDEEDEGYETIASSCDAIRSTIRPSTLPNVKGEMTEVYQSTKFLQEIHIEKCAFKTRHNLSYEECHTDRQLHSSQKHICHEVHLRVILTAGSEGNQRNEEFYYPTNCVCELMRLKDSP